MEENVRGVEVHIAKIVRVHRTLRQSSIKDKYDPDTKEW